VWRNQYAGVNLLPRYYANRLNKRETDGSIFWDFALDSERRPYKTYKRAYQACCKAAGIVLSEEKTPKRKRRASRGREVWETPPATLIPKVADLIPPKNRGRQAKVKSVAQELLTEPVPKKRGRPKGSKNKVKNE
jgi:hypothetical protein